MQERRSGSSHSHGGRRPVKVWNANRNVRKALVVGTYDEFLRKGKTEHLGEGHEHKVTDEFKLKICKIVRKRKEIQGL